ncbi:kinase-like domain-containing protein [Abortiporus biennis]|nr:kinase-like domain-containing protein [Abortiporus biennis]
MLDLWTSFLQRLLFAFTVPMQGETGYLIRLFRFRIPWIVKITPRTTSTEAHALQFLHSTGLKIPIPRLVTSFAHAGITYTVMTRVPGTSLLEAAKAGLLSPDMQRDILLEVCDVLKALDTLRQPDEPEISGKVMLSTSGHELPDPRYFFEECSGPFPSVLALWMHVASYDDVDEFERDVDVGIRNIMKSDPIRFVHPDLRMYNVIIKDGHLSGIVDWEDSGWFPSS